jgi:hypothetical protein
VGPEFFAAFQIARMALDGIRSCVDMLNEGKGELQAVTGEIKQGVESAKQIYAEVTNFWGWIKNLFGGSSEPTHRAVLASSTSTATSSEPAKQEVKQAKKQTDEGPSVDDVIEQFLTHFTNFVEAQTTILDTIEDEREKILNVWNPKQNNRRAAIDLIRYERRINDMALELSGLMASAPRKLGSVREQFQEKLDIVQEAQARAKERARIRRLQESWQRDLLRNHRIDRAVATVWVAIVLIWIWATLLSLGWLAKTPAGLSLLWSS